LKIVVSRSAHQGLLQFIPPDIVFAFQYTMSYPIWSPPTITLKITFQFSVRLRLGFVLDTKGIREAVVQKAPLKALNSFALMDKFNGVDDAMITLTASIILTAEASAVLVQIGVSGGLYFIVEIDLYDPYPETSNGLVRPFELLSVGESPATWFEFTLRIYVTLSLYIEISVKIALVEVTLWSYVISWNYEIVPKLKWVPQPKPPPNKLDTGGNLRITPKSPTMMLSSIASSSSTLSSTSSSATAAAIASNDDVLECTGLNGTLADEFIECKVGVIFSSSAGVKQVVANEGQGSILLRNIQSPANLVGYILDSLTLDYAAASSSAGSNNVLSNHQITLREKSALVGSFDLQFDTLLGTAQIALPQPEDDFLETVVSNCNNHWLLNGHTNLYLKVNEMKENCIIDATGGNSTKAILTIDFDFAADKANCQNGNKVTVRATADQNFTEVKIHRAAGASEKTFDFMLPKAFTDFNIYMSACQDEVLIESTLDSMGSISIYTGDEDDRITIGGGGSATKVGLHDIYKSFYIDAGRGNDSMMIDDAGSLQSKNAELSSGSINDLIRGATNNNSQSNNENSYAALDFVGVEALHIKLSSATNNFTVSSTTLSSITTIEAGPSNSDDIFTIAETMGDLDIYANGGQDQFWVYGLGEYTTARLFGGEGDDLVFIDGTDYKSKPADVNALHLSTLQWTGGNGRDTATIQSSGVGEFDLELLDEQGDDGAITVYGPPSNNTVLLSRANILAFIHNMTDANSTVERIHLINGNSTIPAMTAPLLPPISIHLEGVENAIYFDDTFSTISVYGGNHSNGTYVARLMTPLREQQPTTSRTLLSHLLF